MQNGRVSGTCYLVMALHDSSFIVALTKSTIAYKITPLV